MMFKRLEENNWEAKYKALAANATEEQIDTAAKLVMVANALSLAQARPFHDVFREVLYAVELLQAEEMRAGAVEQ